MPPTESADPEKAFLILEQAEIAALILLGSPLSRRKIIGTRLILTYEVADCAPFMLRNGVSTIGIALDFLLLITTFAGLVAIASRLYARMGE